MSKIIFSIYTNNIEPHKSSTDFKKSQFEKYKHQLEQRQKKYAFICDAEYVLFDTETTSYDMIQFEKLYKLEQLADDYDGILYLDFDIVPQTNISFFDYWDLNSICGHAIDRTPTPKDLRHYIKNDSFDTMNMYCKMCAKNAMLLLDDIDGRSDVINTGVVGGNKNVLQQLQFKDRFESMNKLLDEAKVDNLFPNEINRHWKYNNEVYISYLIERYDIPFTNIGMPWNYFMDGFAPEISPAAHLLHHVNKEFERSFGEN